MHNDRVCPKYNEPVLPDENGKCSLCGADVANMGEVYICGLCQRAYEPEEVNGVKRLKKFKGYFVDLRLQQFRTAFYMFPEFGDIQAIGIDFIEFASPQGKALLAQMHEQVTA